MDRIEREIARQKKLATELSKLTEIWAARPELPAKPTPNPFTRATAAMIRG